MKKKKKKSFLFWLSLVVLMSVCVYCSLPKQIREDQILKEEAQSKTEEQINDVASAYDELMEAFFKDRPVRDVPETADFSAFLQANFARKRKDLTHLAQSYEKVFLSDPENLDVKNTLYMHFLLAGDVSKAALYANDALEVRKRKKHNRIIGDFYPKGQVGRI